jgi:hypothetical protein
LAFGHFCLSDECTANLDDAMALVADFDDAVALGSKEPTAFKKIPQIWISLRQTAPALWSG